MDAIRLQILWEQYLAARKRAEQTEELADGITAGKAWGSFVRAFEGRPDGPILEVFTGGRQ